MKLNKNQYKLNEIKNCLIAATYTVFNIQFEYLV